MDGDGTAVDGLGDLVGEFLGLRHVDQRAEVEGGQRVGRIGDRERMATRIERTAGRYAARNWSKSVRRTTKRR